MDKITKQIYLHWSRNMSPLYLDGLYGSNALNTGVEFAGFMVCDYPTVLSVQEYLTRKSLGENDIDISRDGDTMLAGIFANLNE